jgi:IS1 family transposase
MNTLDADTRARIVAALVEGVSISSIVRMTGVAKTTILRLIRDIGGACQRFHDARVRYVAAERVQCDEVWSFCGMKEKNVPAELKGTVGFGSVWTWTAIEADTKLIISWLASSRSQEAADAFIADLKSRTKPMRLQITSDGYGSYIDAIAKAYPLRNDVDYAEEIKVYQTTGQPGMSPNSAASRYSPGRVKSVDRIPRMGQPLDKFISTSYMERWNLTLRMQKSALHPPYECVLEEVRESRAHARHDHRVLQLLQDAQVARREDAGDGGEAHGLRLDAE